MISRQRVTVDPKLDEEPPERPSFASSIVLTSLVVVLAVTLPWARRWMLSGSALESLLLLYGSSSGSRIFPQIPLWTLLASLNLVYAVSSTSWLLYGVFTAVCYPSIFLTLLFQLNTASDLARRWLRKVLRGLHFTRDTIAFFDLPAIEVDTEITGLFVVRGVSISLSSLTVVAHGVELGLKLSDDMELALYVDQVQIDLFRRIIIGEVYGNIKGGKAEMMFADLDAVDSTDDDSVFQADSALLRAATGASGGLRPPRPSIPRSMTGGSYMKDSSVRQSLGTVRTLSPDDSNAEKQYNKTLKHIETSSHVYEARKQASKTNGTDAFALENEEDMRAAICAKLQNMPSVPHPPTRSVRVTTLQNLSPPWVRDFLHRLPFLLRLLLLPLSYFHPISISSISAAGSGQWLTSLLQENMFKHYASKDAEIRRLERKISAWLASANFSVQMTDIAGLGQVPLSTNYDIVTFLRFADIMAYRTALNTGDIREVAHLGGADATFTIPSFLLPHHEHLLPHKPTTSDLENQVDVMDEADGKVKTLRAENVLEKMKADETEITISVHVSLPACFDQSLVNFVAALVKATKVIELEKTLDDSEPDDLPTPPTSPTNSIEAVAPPSRTGTGFKTFATGIRQNIKDGATSESIKGLARDLQKNTKDGVRATNYGLKKAVGGMVNDRWIAKIVGKIAAKLEQAQGDIGYSGGVPIALERYRGAEDLPSKLLP